MTADQILRVVRVPFDHPDAVALRAAMISEVAELYADLRDDVGESGANSIDPQSVTATLVGYVADRGVSHALLRRRGDDLEIKRMYVAPELRGRGAADTLMAALLRESRILGASRIVLHTGERQIAAVRLYERLGFTPIPVYEPYLGVPGSLCFEKVL